MKTILSRLQFGGGGFIIVVTLAALTAYCGAFEPQLTKFQFSERHMGTLFQITLFASDQKTADRAAKAAFRRAAELDERLTDYQSTSELMRLCARAGTGPVAVSDELFEVLSRGQEFSRLTDGAFDPTVGPVVRLWRLSRRTRQLPPRDELQTALALVGRQWMRLDGAGRTVDLQKAGMRLDLGGIAKGFAADKMLLALRDAGTPIALVAAGGDVVAGEPPPNEPGWKVAIAALTASDKPPTLVLKNAAVSTSGDTEQFVEIGGTRYSHVVDPNTGMGITVRCAVTIVAANGTTSDALTKVAVLGPDKAMKLIESMNGVGMRFATIDGDKVVVRETKMPKPPGARKVNICALLQG